jgi:hypothetical protein
MIWRKFKYDWNDFFNLEFIYSFKKWSWTKLLLTFINKEDIKEIRLLKSSSYLFWDKIKNICEQNNIKFIEAFQG